MKINELFNLAIETENSLLAHALYCGLMDGQIEGTDQANESTYERIDTEKAYQMHKDNALGLKIMNLYAVPLASKEFAMFFAANEAQAKKLFREAFHIECKKIHEMNHGMDMSMYSFETKKHQTWREIRDSLPNLPAYVGTFIK